MTRTILFWLPKNVSLERNGEILVFPSYHSMWFWHTRIEQWEQFEGQIQTIPESVTIRAQVVSFTDFQKQYEEVHVEGIDLTIFDRVLSIATPLTMHSCMIQLVKSLLQHVWLIF
jgi:hypothetical protein